MKCLLTPCSCASLKSSKFLARRIFGAETYQHINNDYLACSPLVNGGTFHGSQLHLLTLPQNNTVEKTGKAPGKAQSLGPAFGHTGLCRNLETIPARQLSPKWQSKFTFSAKKSWHSSKSGVTPEPPTTGPQIVVFQCLWN